MTSHDAALAPVNSPIFDDSRRLETRTEAQYARFDARRARVRQPS